jgi:hypothetical protein
MSRFDKPVPDDLVTRYLLGTVLPDEAERLDELSIADDEFASRLSAVEKDLVDAYVRGELSSEKLARFKAVYLSSPVLRQKVAFAESFLPLADRNEAAARARPAAKGFPRWALAAAACLVLSAGSLLVYRSPQPAPKSAPQPASEAKALPPAQSQPGPPPSPAPPRIPTTVAMVLLPQLRNSGPIPILNLPPATDHAIFHLQLESDEFAGYRVALRNPATDQIVWRTGLLHSTARDENRVVPVTAPGTLFESRNYTLELTGVAASGAAEFAGSYTFRVAR